MKSGDIQRRSLAILFSSVFLTNTTAASDLRPLQSDAAAYVESPTAMKEINRQLSVMFGEESATYVSILPTSNGTAITLKEKASLQRQFAQVFSVIDHTDQTLSGDSLITAHERGNPDQMAFVLLRGTTATVLAAALLHSNCARGLTDQLAGQTQRKRESPCDKTPTLTIFYPKKQAPLPDDVEAFAQAAKTRIQAMNLRSSKVSAPSVVNKFAIRVRRLN